MITVRVEKLSKRYRAGKGGSVIGMPPLVPERFRRRPRKQPPSIWALRKVSLKAAEGEVLGVIGPNGAGKSTLLKVLARVTAPTEGRARVYGRVVPLLELGAAFQPGATGRENVFLNAALYGIPRDVVARRLEEVFAFAELERFVDVPLTRYSSGMYLRLAFSVAVNLEPDILLADEVLAIGDLAFQERCLRRVEEAGRRGLTTLFVSHDMAAIRRLCDRVAWLDGGQVRAIGSAEEVVTAYEQDTWQRLGGGKGRHKSGLAEILQCRLLRPDGGEIGAARIDHDALIRLRLRTFKAKVSARAVLAVQAAGLAAFRTAQPQAWLAREPGIYDFTVRIPAHLLADTTYTVKAGVVLNRGGKETTVVQENALTFNVYEAEKSESAGGDYPYLLPGVLRPRLQWHVSRGDGGTVVDLADRRQLP